ncbi:putative metallopeptidase [Nanoarchaeota archaeon]
MIKYFPAPDVERKMKDIVPKIGMSYIDPAQVSCIRSRGSTSRRTIARCHGMAKVLQIGMRRGAHYVIEVISEEFDKLSQEEQTKVVIHELMHIPKNFGGGFRHHDYVTKRNVDKLYRKYMGRDNSVILNKLNSKSQSMNWFLFR